MNELTARRIAIPGQTTWEVTGEGWVPEGDFRTVHGKPTSRERSLLDRLSFASVLCNEGVLGRRNEDWVHHGDTVDVALLVMARKAGLKQSELVESHPLVAQMPFESERQFSATLNEVEDGVCAFVKGAPERLLKMCDKMASPDGDLPLDASAANWQAIELANAGYRVLAVAAGKPHLKEGGPFCEDDLHGLTFLGLVGMIDPLRPEAKSAVAACRRSGIEVSMVTGDHPLTALSIARDLKMAEDISQVVAGPELKKAELEGFASVDALTSGARVFAIRAVTRAWRSAP